MSEAQSSAGRSHVLLRGVVPILFGAFALLGCGEADGRPDPEPGKSSAGLPCTMGADQPCPCEDSESMGSQTCTPNGWGDCACAYEWPYIGPTCADGAVECEPLGSEDTDFAGHHCCTAEQKCGLGNSAVFGNNCVERKLNPEGVPTEDCGETIIPFVQTTDCCRPDGACGLWLEYPNWDDLGCVERTELATLLKNSPTLGFFLCFINNECDALDNLAANPGTCTYPE